MKRFCFLFVFVFLALGCNKSVVRDAKVYKEELNFFDSAADEVVTNGKAIIASKCECSEVNGNIEFTSSECANLADTILVLESRVKYHTAMMRFNSGMIDERPPSDPPVIPSTDTLCPVIEKDGGE